MTLSQPTVTVTNATRIALMLVLVTAVLTQCAVASQSEEGEYTCPICYADGAGEDFAFLGCGHYTCVGCMRRCISTRRWTDPTCPARAIGDQMMRCQHRITDQELQDIMTNEDYQRRVALHLEMAARDASRDAEAARRFQEKVQSHPNIYKRCPGLNCAAIVTKIIVITDARGHRVSAVRGDGCDDVTCFTCGHQYCWTCLHPTHRGPVPPCLTCGATGLPSPALVQPILTAADGLPLGRVIAELIVGYLPCHTCGGSGNMVPPNTVGHYVGCNGWNHQSRQRSWSPQGIYTIAARRHLASM